MLRTPAKNSKSDIPWNCEKPMDNASDNPTPAERRSDPRIAPDRYYSVQFAVEGLPHLYQFKIWNVSETGLCILVKDDSEVLNHLRVGDLLTAQYYASDAIGSTEEFHTEIRHISPGTEKRFRGHTLVGLRILQ